MSSQTIAFWKRYYYSYLKNFIEFSSANGQSDCFSISDVLSRVDDVQSFLTKTKKSLGSGGRLIITQYNALWEPILRLASWLNLRKGPVEQNWLTMGDLKNFAYLAGLETIKSGTKMIMPVYVPLLSSFLNRFLANLWPFSRLGLFHYVIARKPEIRHPNKQPSLSIIVPTRNEAGTIEKIVRELPECGFFT